MCPGEIAGADQWHTNVMERLAQHQVETGSMKLSDSERVIPGD